jgi:hypothetical protein
MDTVLNISLINPSNPRLDRLSKTQWKNPLVSLDKAIRNTVGERDIVIGDPTDFSSMVNRKDPKTGKWIKSFGSMTNTIDWGWDLDMV